MPIPSSFPESPDALLDRLGRDAPPVLYARADNAARWSETLELTSVARGFRDTLLAEAEAIVPREAITYRMEGRRLMAMARSTLSNPLRLAAAWLLQPKERFRAAAIREMHALLQFPDWNPGHFLDVAETAAAFGAAYAVLYDTLTEEERTVLADGLHEKAIDAFVPFDPEHHWWKRVHHNWNQVCHGGTGIAALALAHRYPESCYAVLASAVRNIPRALPAYGPDGVYPEGSGYWGYGTTYQVLLMHALDRAMGTRFGLDEAPGFRESVHWLAIQEGTSGRAHNFGDNSSAAGRQAALLWFAQTGDDPQILGRAWSRWERHITDGLSDQEDNLEQSRFLPWAVTWLGDLALTQPPSSPERPDCWIGQGDSPVAYLYAADAPAETWVACKAGSPFVNHGHMDVGSFIIEAFGLRWATDIEKDYYHDLEKRGLQIFDRAQAGDRWRVFRNNQHGHNILTVDGRPQQVDGVGSLRRRTVEDDTPGRTVDMDLGPVYAGQLASLRRTIVLQADGCIKISDTWQAEPDAETVTVAFLTEATVDRATSDPSSIVLQLEGRRLVIAIEAADDVRWSAGPIGPLADHDRPDDTLTHVRITLPAPAGRLGQTWQPQG